MFYVIKILAVPLVMVKISSGGTKAATFEQKMDKIRIKAADLGQKMDETWIFCRARLNAAI